MTRSFDASLADYPLYQEGYDHGVMDADRDHRLDYPIGILLGVGMTCFVLYGIPWLIQNVFS